MEKVIKKYLKSEILSDINQNKSDNLVKIKELECVLANKCKY